MCLYCTLQVLNRSLCSRVACISLHVSITILYPRWLCISLQVLIRMLCHQRSLWFHCSCQNILCSHGCLYFHCKCQTEYFASRVACISLRVSDKILCPKGSFIFTVNVNHNALPPEEPAISLHVKILCSQGCLYFQWKCQTDNYASRVACISLQVSISILYP